MSKPADFQALVALAMTDQARVRMRPVVEKELLHYDILFALDEEGLLDQLTFQGGTSLRLCYGSPRYSEDLDFAGGLDFDARQVMNMKSCLERYVGERYGLEVTVKEPTQVALELRGKNVKVHKWQIRIVTAPGRPDLPKQMIKLEVANVPAYTRVPQLLKRNYDFLPDWYDNVAIMVETREEIMADKLVALVDCPRLRHRDIWDLLWLHQQNTETAAELVRHKLVDYQVEHYATKVDQLIERLPDIIRGKEFKDQMARFLPQELQDRALRNENFLAVMQHEVTRLLKRAKQEPVQL